MKYTDERVREIVDGPRRHRVIPLPGNPEVKVAVRVLTEAEIEGCRVEAQVQLRKEAQQRSWDPGGVVLLDPQLFQQKINRQIVWRAFFDADTLTGETPPQLFFESEAVVMGLDTDTVDRFLEAYLEHKQWVSPLRALTVDEAKEFLEALKKTPDPAVLLSGFEHRALVNLLISTAFARPSTT